MKSEFYKLSWLQLFKGGSSYLKIKLRSVWIAYMVWPIDKANLKKIVYLEGGIFFFLLFCWWWWDVILWDIGIVQAIPSKCDGVGIADIAKCTDIARNFGWMSWMLFSVIGVGVGLWLTWQGRQIQQRQWKTQNDQWNTQHESHLQERFEKAVDMLSSDLEITRIAACSSLVNLSKSDESMKSQCVNLLFDFIRNPYLEADDKGKNLDSLFPIDEDLRADIQSAIESFCAIYKYYNECGMDVDGKISKLPPYFWKNKRKGKVFLMKAISPGINLRDETPHGAYLIDADFHGANLRSAGLTSAELYNINLQGANLEHINAFGAIFQGANLQGANLQDAFLSNALLNLADLHKANLRGARLEGADLQGARMDNSSLRRANLEGAYLHGIIFSEVDLNEANLQDADISTTDMREAKNLTKEQVLSAKWGYGDRGNNPKSNRLGKHSSSSWPSMGTAQPQLPERLMQDKDIQEWLETPAYDERENPEDSE